MRNQILFVSAAFLALGTFLDGSALSHPSQVDGLEHLPRSPTYQLEKSEYDIFGQSEENHRVCHTAEFFTQIGLPDMYSEQIGFANVYAHMGDQFKCSFQFSDQAPCLQKFKARLDNWLSFNDINIQRNANLSSLVESISRSEEYEYKVSESGVFSNIHLVRMIYPGGSLNFNSPLETAHDDKKRACAMSSVSDQRFDKFVRQIFDKVPVAQKFYYSIPPGQQRNEDD